MSRKHFRHAFASIALTAAATLALAACGGEDDPPASQSMNGGEPGMSANQTMPEPQPEPTPEPQPEPMPEPQPEPIVIANNVAHGTQLFAFDFYKTLLESEDGSNIFFSPYSITTAYGMVYAGARGDTAQQIQQALRFPQDGIPRSFKDLQERFNQPDNQDYALNTANGIWVQQDYPILLEYLHQVTAYYDYDARLGEVDFKENAMAAEEEINDWTSDNTEGLIEEIVKDLTKYTRLVLVNAIYFKGAWQYPFDAEETRDREFRTPNGTVNAPFMHQTAHFRYAEDGTLQILELPYKGDDLSMLIILPAENNPAALEQTLDANTLNSWRQQLQRYIEVEVALPKFKAESEYNLIDELKKMGVTDAFNSAPPGSSCMTDAVPPDTANFQGIDGTRCLYISQSTHKAVVEVNETGTEAAAATSVVLSGPTSVPPPPTPFTADRPFIFMIQDNQSGSILFMGKINDPTQ